jgi:hypothetical protein
VAACRLLNGRTLPSPRVDWCSCGFDPSMGHDDDGFVNQLDQVLASFTLAIWLVLIELTLLRTAVAGLFRGKWWWFHPGTPSRVDRSEPAATLNEARFRRRRLEFLLALGLGWIPGPVFQSVLGSGDSTINGAILVVSAVGAIVYLLRSLRRFDREGRERYVTRTILEGQEPFDSLR